MNGNINYNIKNSIVQTLEVECIKLFINAYLKAKKKNEYSVDWEEDNFTAHLCGYLEDLRIEGQWSISPQFPLYTEEIKKGEKKAVEADKPDLKFEKYHTSGEYPFQYFIEAKIICSNDWVKTSGANVSASYQRGRYIDTGIDNFINNVYPYGSIAGYVTNGSIKEVTDKLNDLIIYRKRDSEVLEKKSIIEGCNFIYLSKHDCRDNFELKHIFLDFY